MRIKLAMLLLLVSPAFANVMFVYSKPGPNATFGGNAVNGTGGANTTTIGATITVAGAHSACIAHFQQSITGGAFTSGTVTDNHAHTYTMTPLSPYGPVTTIADTFVAGIAYLSVCPQGSSVVTWTATGIAASLFASIDVLEVPYKGNFKIDKDAVHTYPSSTLTVSPAVLPTITPTNRGSFCDALFTTDQGAQQTTPGAPWTAIGNGAGVFGAYYYPSTTGTGSIAASFPDSVTPDSAGVIIGCFGGSG